MIYILGEPEEIVFSALTLLVRRQEEHPVCEKSSDEDMRCWCGYLSIAVWS